MPDTQHTRPFQRQMVTAHTLYPQPTADHAPHRYRINSFEQTTDPSGHISQALPSGIPPYGIFMIEKNRIITRIYESPCGTLMLGSFGDKLCLCDWQVEKHRNYVENRLCRILDAEFEEGTSAVIDNAILQLEEYFNGKRQEFDIPLLFVGTDFQKKVWNRLLSIPFGKTISYGEMARQIGMQKAVRAVANANGANSMSIFAPCHRVIGSDHTLTGYGGGLAVKEYLLKLENAR